MKLTKLGRKLANSRKQFSRDRRLMDWIWRGECEVMFPDKFKVKYKN